MAEYDPGWLAGKVVQGTPDAVIAADGDGKVILWNSGAERIFGYTAAEAIGQSLDLIIPERLRKRHWDAYQASMASGTTKYGSDELLAVPAERKDGTRISIEFTITLLRDDAGRLIGPAAVIRDVTARWNEQNELRKRLRDLEAKLPAAVEGSAAAT
ncbi:MAG TPA: PAS domain S-box protein [Dehalococcoidia bacterium]|nr:PAS domain S-box protein [Dehalococcoidia bacterium]